MMCFLIFYSRAQEFHSYLTINDVIFFKPCWCRLVCTEKSSLV